MNAPFGEPVALSRRRPPLYQSSTLWLAVQVAGLLGSGLLRPGLPARQYRVRL